MSLHITSFGGGTVLAGSADQRRIDEVLRADGFDIGARGALVCTTDPTAYTTLLDNRDPFNGLVWTRLHGLSSALSLGKLYTIALGEGGADVMGTPAYLHQQFARQGAPNPASFSPGGEPLINTALAVITPPRPEGVVVTFASFPGVFTIHPGLPNIAVNIALMCVGAREGFAPRVAPGLYALFIDPTIPIPVFTARPIGLFDALGTGAFGELPVGGGAAGTHAQQLFPRGVIAYNNFVWCYGFDSADATNGDGPNRVMFCNQGLPLKWGNDNINTAGNDRLFTDSDAIVLGDAGEIIRGAIKWAGRLWFGTNQQMHFIGGFGRESFLTDGATPVMKAFNVVGPNGLLEGPDRKMYGMSDQGLWRTPDGAEFEPLFRRVVDFDGHSSGYWDCIWTDNSRNANSYPGVTNQDLIWMVSDRDRRQVVIGIPFCNLSSGSGFGPDTLLVKYHVDTGGFTRQPIFGVQYTAAAYLRREGQQPDARFLGTASAGAATIQRYGYQSGPTASPVLPAVLPSASFGWYSPFGPDGDGVVRRVYLTLAAESPFGIPLVFEISTTVDQAPVDSFTLYVQDGLPAAAVAGDIWLDTSETDTSLGNATAGVTLSARHGFLLKTLDLDGSWLTVAGQGTQGNRVTIQLPMTRVVGTRFTMDAVCIQASSRFQIEGFGLNPGAGSPLS